MKKQKKEIIFVQDDEDISTMNQAPTLLNSSNEFSFGNLQTNQTVPENNNEENNARFQF